MLNKKKLEKFRNLLQQQLDELSSNENKTKEEIVVKDSFADLTDRASHETDQQFELRIRDRERKLKNKIKKTLLKIDDNTFGICESCGDYITEERLLARPVTDLCINCKMDQEHEEKHYDD